MSSCDDDVLARSARVMHDLGASWLSAGLQNLDDYPVEDQSA